MRWLLEKLNDAYPWVDWEMVFAIVIPIIAAILVSILLIIGYTTGFITTNGDSEAYNAIQWTANPANPASPLH